VGFQPRCEDMKTRWRSDVLWQIVPDTSSGDREGSIADGGESRSADNQWWRRGRAPSLSRLEISWSAEFVDEVRRCQPMQAFVYEDGEFEVSPFSNLQPMELMKNRSDVVEFRRRINQPSSCMHNRLEPLKMWVKVRTALFAIAPLKLHVSCIPCRLSLGEVTSAKPA